MPYDILQVVLETAQYMLTTSSTLKSELTFSDISDADALITSQSAYRNDIFLRDRRVAFVIFMILMNYVSNAHIWYKHQRKNGLGTNTNGKTGRRCGVWSYTEVADNVIILSAFLQPLKPLCLFGSEPERIDIVHARRRKDTQWISVLYLHSAFVQHE